VGEFSAIRRSPRRRFRQQPSVPELFAYRSVHHTNNPLRGSDPMNGIIYLIGLIVVVMAILSFLGLR
jgi:hypothetical protein